MQSEVEIPNTLDAERHHAKNARVLAVMALCTRSESRSSKTVGSSLAFVIISSTDIILRRTAAPDNGTNHSGRGMNLGESNKVASPRLPLTVA